MKFIVVSSSGEMISSIKRYLKYVHSIHDVKSFLVNNPGEKAYENFLVIWNWLEGLFPDDLTAMKRTMAFIDLPVYNVSSFVPTADGAEALAALLYLSFPEIHWVFSNYLYKTDKKENSKQEISDQSADETPFIKFHSILGTDDLNLENAIQLFMMGYTPLFDPTGERSLIIQRALKKMVESGEDYLTHRPFFLERNQKSLVVDEEVTYAYLHSYVAYKLNYRAFLASSKTMLDAVNGLFEKKSKEEGFKLSFEDICLSFPDKKISNKLYEREEGKNSADTPKYPFFQNIPKRIFVTIGEKKGLKKENKNYRVKLKTKGKLKFYKILHKPYAGIFNLIKAAKLKPEKFKPKNPEHENISGHSAPGRFGVIADVLIDRSRRIIDQAGSAVDAVYAAVLALQAQEILGGRTATLSIKAISLKHQAEVKAECMFYGVEHNFDVKSRFKEIKNELAVIGRWFTKSKRDIMIYNSALNIVNELARIFRQYSQFDEELICMNEVRSLNRKIYRKRNKLWGWLVSPLRRYFELLIGSLPRFLAAIVLWPALFTLLFYIASPENIKSFGNAFMCAVNSFFALQVTIIKDTPGVPALSIAATLLGFFHLGIFISHLYTIVSRR